MDAEPTPFPDREDPEAVEAPDATDSLTLDEVAELYNFDRGRLRRRVLAGGLPGAFMTQTTEGLQWRIPRQSLERLGYTPTADVVPAAPTAVVEAAPPPEAMAGDGPLLEEPPRLTRAWERVDAAWEEVYRDRDRLARRWQRLEDERARLDSAFADLHADRERQAEILDLIEKRLAELADAIAPTDSRRDVGGEPDARGF
ncbi:MAG TPA: helix-turn-helix domain-containing protein [Acidimicrobiales bacterium]|nr:helix-turn-helix domain-containing protein [Acidimicrobiales bacterium]